MKTLDQVEARTTITNLPVYILNPGSYYLTGEHTGTATNNGITIQADDVTIASTGSRSAVLRHPHP